MLDFAASAAEEGGGAAAQSRLLYMLQATHRMLRPGGLLCIISARGWPNAAPIPGLLPGNGRSASGLPGVDACWWRWPKVAKFLESHFTEALEAPADNEHELDETDAEEETEPDMEVTGRPKSPAGGIAHRKSESCIRATQNKSNKSNTGSRTAKSEE